MGTTEDLPICAISFRIFRYSVHHIVLILSLLLFYFAISRLQTCCWCCYCCLCVHVQSKYNQCRCFCFLSTYFWLISILFIWTLHQIMRQVFFSPIHEEQILVKSFYNTFGVFLFLITFHALYLDATSDNASVCVFFFFCVCVCVCVFSL